jgi:hypothetical protein
MIILNSCMAQIICEDHGEDLVLLEYVHYDKAVIPQEEFASVIAGHLRHSIKFVSTFKEVVLEQSETGRVIRQVA